MDGGPSVDMTNDSKTGNYPGRIKTNPSESTVSSKGKSFNVC